MVALVKVSAILILVVALSRRKLDFTLIMAVAAIASALAFGMTLQDSAAVALRSVTSSSNLLNVAVVALVGLLKALMVEAGMLGAIVQSLNVLVRDRRAVVAILPAFVGLLPSAGGAVMSCPMVNEAAQGMGLSAEQKATANYWYRHVIEHVVPVYPAFILASQISDTPIRLMMLYTLPAAVVHVVTMAVLLFGKVPREEMMRPAAPAPVRRRALRTLMLNTGPIALSVALVIVFEWHISIASLLAIGLMLPFTFPGWGKMRRIAAESFLSRPVLMVAGIMLFKDVLVASGAVQQITQFLSDTGAPPLAMAVVLPFAVSAVAGMTSASVGVTFPMLAGIFAASQSGHALAAAAYVSAVAGLMVAPTHLCLVLTADYFKADIGRMIRTIAVPDAMVLASGIVPYLISRVL